MPKLDDTTKNNLRRLFEMADFKPEDFIESVAEVNMQEKGTWFRLKFNDRVQQPRRRLDPQLYHLFHGLHCTSASGAVSILKSRELRKMSFDGVYCLMTMNPKNFEDFRSEVASKVLWGKRDVAWISFELVACGEHDSHSSGGVEKDSQSCAAGKISHMRAGKENRYCVPEDLIKLHAMWLTCGSIENIASCHLLSL